MADMIIVVLVVLLMILAAKQAAKHFRGEGACCGGGSGASKAAIKKLAGPILGEKTIAIEGMQCERCEQKVTEAINKIQGVSAKVFLKEKKAVVSYENEVKDETLKRAVEGAGYKVRSII